MSKYFDSRISQVTNRLSIYSYGNWTVGRTAMPSVPENRFLIDFFF